MINHYHLLEFHQLNNQLELIQINEIDNLIEKILGYNHFDHELELLNDVDYSMMDHHDLLNKTSELECSFFFFLD
jgi:hemerythrin